MIWNLIKTSILFAILTGILLTTSYVLGFSPLLAIGFAAVLNLGVYWFSDRIVLAMTRAKKISEAERPELHAIVNRLASNAGVPTPSIAVVESPVPNAFATGRREEGVPSRCADLSDFGILISVKRVECDALSQG